MFDLINGLPVHPLVVHGVVVLLPLACLGTIAIAVRPAWRGKYGVLVVACAAVATALIPVSTSSGETLEKHVGNAREHAELGEQLIWFAIPLLLLSFALVWLERRQHAATAEEGVPTSTADQKSSTAIRAVAALALVAAVATSVQVYRVGDSGARAAWGDRVQSSH